MHTIVERLAYPSLLHNAEVWQSNCEIEKKNYERKKVMMVVKQLEPKILYSVNIYELVPEDNFYRRLSEFLDLRFVYQECKSVYGKTGNPSIDPVVFFRIVLFGYFENIISDRELIRRASDSLGVRLYLGYDFDEELPWHSTISRTRARIPEEVFEKLFDKILRMCIDQGLVGGEHQSVGSTLVKANASLESLEKKVPKLELSKYIKATKEENQAEEIPEEKRETEEESNQIAPPPDSQEPKMEIVSALKPKKNSLLIASVQNLKRLITFGKWKVQVEMRMTNSSLIQKARTFFRNESWSLAEIGVRCLE